MHPENKSDTDKTADVASRIADGAEISWSSLDSQSIDPETLAVIKELRAVNAVASLHRATALEVDGALVAGPWGGLTNLEKIAEGRFGEVYRAWEPSLERYVALKLLRTPAASDSSLPTQAIDEARLLARVKHPNVLTIHGAENRDGVVGIWTEFIEGRTLEELLAERGPLPADEVVAIGVTLCDALSAVHAAGLLHRDVKTQNVMREVGGRIVLMDFGTVAAHEDGAHSLAGTPLYMAPELFRGAKPTTAGDIYSVAAVLFRLLTGKYPVPGRTLDDVKAAHAAGSRPRVGAHAQNIPDRLAGVIERGLATDPAARFQSAADFATALTGTGGRKAGWMPIAVAVASVLAVIGIWSMVDFRSDVPSLVCRDCLGPNASFNRDGTMAVLLHTPTGDLQRRSFPRGLSERLFAKQGDFTSSKSYAETPVLSADGQQIAYRWIVRDLATRSESNELRIMANRPGATSRLIAGAEVINATPLDWKPDKSAILAVTGPDRARQLVWIDPATNEVTPLKPIRPIGSILNAHVSPDGQYVVCAVTAGTFAPRTQGRNPNESYLHLLKSDGTVDRPLVNEAAQRSGPVWPSASTITPRRT